MADYCHYDFGSNIHNPIFMTEFLALSIYLVYRSACLSIYLPTYLSIYLYIYNEYTYIYIYLFNYIYDDEELQNPRL